MAKMKITFLIGSIFFALGLATLTNYNINYDTINHLPRGQAYLRYIVTGKRDYSDLPKPIRYWQKPESLFIDTEASKKDIVKRSIYQNDSLTYDYFLEYDGDGHPPLSDILSSGFNIILFQKLRIINDIDSYRVYGLILASALVGLVYWWGASLYGKIPGIVAAIVIASHPLFWSHAHFNTEKDIPETAFYSFFIFSFWRGITTKSKKWLLVAGLFFGLALGTKLNIIFSFFIITPWLFYYVFSNIPSEKKVITNFFKNNFVFLLTFFSIPIIGLIILIASWPYLWSDPVHGIMRMFGFYKSLGLAKSDANTYALQTIIYTTPIIVIVLSIVGFVTSILRNSNEKDKISMLFILWLLVPVLRVSIPGTNIHGGVRQIMEFVPAMAMLSGLGAKSVLKFLTKKTSSYIAVLIILLPFVTHIANLTKIHPYEQLFFNSFMGGLSGAKEKDFPFWGETYGEQYRLAVEWLNNNAPENSELVFVYELMPNIPPIFLRTDFVFSNVLRSGFLKRGEYAVTMLNKGTQDRSYYDMYLENFLKPVYVANVNGVPILKMWKNDEAHLKKPWIERLDTKAVAKVSDSSLLIELFEEKSLSKLEIDYTEKQCSALENGIAYISRDGSLWDRLPGNLPDDWRVSYLGAQPREGKFIEPFVGQQVKFIRIDLFPVDTCLKKVKEVRVYYFDS